MTGHPPTGTWCRISRAAVVDPKLSAEAFRVLAVLGGYVDAQGYCCPAVGTIADQLGLRRRQVQRHLRTVEALGYLSTFEQKRVNGKGGNSSNMYLLQFPPAPSLKRAPAPAKDPEPHAPSGVGAKPSSDGGSAIASGASSHDAMVDSGASSDDAPPPDLDPEEAEIGGAVRHPEASGASWEGKTGASSHDAQTIPILTIPNRTSPKPRARTRETGLPEASKVASPKTPRGGTKVARQEETGAKAISEPVCQTAVQEERSWKSTEGALKVRGNSAITRWINEGGDGALEMVRAGLATMDADTQAGTLVMIAVGALGRDAFLAEMAELAGYRAEAVAA